MNRLRRLIWWLSCQHSWTDKNTWGFYDEGILVVQQCDKCGITRWFMQ
jgi:hypothetical protein